MRAWPKGDWRGRRTSSSRPRGGCRSRSRRRTVWPSPSVILTRRHSPSPTWGGGGRCKGARPPRWRPSSPPARASDGCAWAIGPSIGPCCYEVDEPVIAGFREAYPRDWERWVRPGRPGTGCSTSGRANEDLLARPASRARPSRTRACARRASQICSIRTARDTAAASSPWPPFRDVPKSDRNPEAPRQRPAVSGARRALRGHGGPFEAPHRWSRIHGNGGRRHPEQSRAGKRADRARR